MAMHRPHYYREDIAGPTWLYRLYSRDALAYVGVSSDPKARFIKHRRTKAWWSTVTRAELCWHPSRAAAFAAEREAISNERPIYNIKRPKGAGA